MNKFYKISKLLFLLLFLYSCGSVGEALQGKKRSDQGDEFLINKKNPLAMPPDFNKLPKPGEKEVKSSNDIQSDQSNIEKLLKNKDNKQIINSVEELGNVENSILEKIKK